ncbi:hypothetical protein BC828DRAFT_377732 [Blastocladiella britannica]|nr:hypothetical protein BC828DRAFT_377732 [Blastocladiella britannica]
MANTSSIFICLALALVAAELVLVTNAQSCPNRLRKEIRDLTPKELAAFHDATWKLNKDGTMAAFTALHVKHKDLSHFNPSFLPFHRAMLKNYEDKLLAAAGGALTGLPYWDSTYDANAPEKSVVLSPVFMGTTRAGAQCILDGPFKGLNDGFGGCVKRDLVGGPWNINQPLLLSIMRSYATDYAQFEYYLERGPHFVVHSNIGGSMASLLLAPDDPIFYLHHAFLDMLWGAWQNANPTAATAYGGMANGQTYTLDDQIMDWKARDLLDFKKNQCYDYQVAQWPKSNVIPALAAAKANSTNGGANVPVQPPANNTIGNFQPFSDQFLSNWNLSRSSMDSANRVFVLLTKTLQDMQAQGKSLPTLQDLQNATAMANFDAAFKRPSATGDAAATPTPSSAQMLSASIGAAALFAVAAAVLL